jgi:FkbM family methyltransferase
MNLIVSYAQNREDRILEAFFPNLKKGFYVDVGANHPIKESVTKIFYQKDWNGINVEPNKSLFEMLEFDRPRDINFNIGISNKNGTLEFTEYNGDGLSTFSQATKKEYESSKDTFYHDYAQVVGSYQVEVKTLSEILNEASPEHINFMKIDVEGFEYEVLEGNDWEKYRPEVICIEVNHIKKDWRPLLADKGYELVFFDGLNKYYVAKECKELNDKFSYPNQILLKGFIVSLPIIRKIKKLENEKNILEFRKNNMQKLLQTTLTDSPTRVDFRHTIKSAIKKLEISPSVSVVKRVNTNYDTPLSSLSLEDINNLVNSYRDNTLSIETSNLRIHRKLVNRTKRAIYIPIRKINDRVSGRSNSKRDNI